jgi:hypothetical protein
MKIITKVQVKTEQQIQDLVNQDVTVYWRSEHNTVVKTRKNGYRVKTRVNDHKYLLTHLDKLVDFSGTNDFYYIEGV